jgi:hypothetical protein
MSKPTMSETMSANFAQMPGMGAMNDTLEFVKTMWGGGMKLPGMAMPSLSVESVDKQIADLKAVESWMTLNMNMLRGTIQALEVQSATLSTLQSMSDSMSAMVRPGGMPAMPETIFSFPDTPRHPAAPAAPAAPAEPEPAWKAEPSFSFAPPTPDKPPAPEPAAQPPNGASRPLSGEAAQDGAAAVPPFANPAAWWSLLQDQFKQAVQTAVVAEPADQGASVRAPRKSPSKTAAKSRSAKKPNGSGAKAGRKAAAMPMAAPRSGKSGKTGAASRSAATGVAASRKRKT